MFKTAKLITELFEERGMKYTVDEMPDVNIITLECEGDDHVDQAYHFICNEERNDVTVHSDVIANVPEEKEEEMLELLCQLNSELQFAKIWMDGDNDLMLAMDISREVSDEYLGKVAFEAFYRMIKAFEKVYSRVMKCLWS
jgi:hypothetical protein